MRLLILGVILCSLGLSGPASGQDNADIPPDVLDIAARSLQMWKDSISDQLDTFGLEGKGHLVKGAGFGETYMNYQLSRDDIVRYVASDSSDPSMFASFRTYIFPIYADQVYLGGLRILETEERNDVRAPVEKGDFALVGIDALNSTLPPRVASVASATRTAGMRFLGVVEFTVSKMDKYFILENEATRLFLPNQNATESLLKNLNKDTVMFHARSALGMREVKNQLEGRLRSERVPTNDR